MKNQLAAAKSENINGVSAWRQRRRKWRSGEMA